MDKFVAEHGSAVVYVLGTLCLMLLSVVMYYLRHDRNGFMKKINELDNKIDKNRVEVNEAIDEVESEINSVKTNYNAKFEKVYDKIDSIKTAIMFNHKELIEAIHKVELKIPNQHHQ